MPMVNGKKFPYTAEGKMAAKEAAGKSAGKKSAKVEALRAKLTTFRPGK
jgi:hypothetical protein